MNVNEWIKCVIAGERAPCALVLEGGRGSGKGVAVRLLETLIPGRRTTVISTHEHRRGKSIALGIPMTEYDLVTIEDVRSMNELDAIKSFITSSEVAVDILAVGRETRTVKANVIITADFWPARELPDEARHFIVTSPIAFIAELIPFFAR